MKIGILSDTHNDTALTLRALQEFRRLNVCALVHCGDLTTAEMVPHFDGFEVYFVRGNMDRHQVSALAEVISVQAGAHWIGKGCEIELFGKRIAITHGDRQDLFETMLFSEPDFLFSGHTHRHRDERIGPTRLINPGALGGVQYEPRSICTLDLASDQLELIQL